MVDNCFFSRNDDGVSLRCSSAEEGLLCLNADQLQGENCPDYAVRFLCQH